jgi:hypothetical protein
VTDDADDVQPVSQTEEEIARELVAQAREQGVELVGPGGLLSDLTKRVLEVGAQRRDDRAPRL